MVTAPERTPAEAVTTLNVEPGANNSRKDLASSGLSGDSSSRVFTRMASLPVESTSRLGS